MNRVPSTALAVLFAIGTLGWGADAGAAPDAAPTIARLATVVPDLRPPDIGGGDGRVRYRRGFLEIRP